MTKKKGSDESMPHAYSGMPLRGAVYLYDEAILVQKKNGGVYEVDPAALASAFSDLPLTTGLLPENTLAFQRANSQEVLVVYLPPDRRRLTIAHKKEDRDIVTVPTPGLVFAGCGTRYWIFAVKHRPGDESATLFHAPFPNVYPAGRICPGSVTFPTCTTRTIHVAAQLFFDSEFNHDLSSNKLQADENVLDLWKRLHDSEAEHFPANLLESTGGTLGKLLATNLGED